jgi:deazaflavin-dependent oxidoreductase (nitroreductase family)
MTELSHRADRWLYRGQRPHRLARLINRAWATFAGVGLAPKRLVRLEVTGRRSGATISLPLVVADYQGERFLVSMLGESSNWVRNVRAAGGQAVVRHGRREDVLLEEVEPGLRAPILRRYLECAPGARSHIPVERRAPTEEFNTIAPSIPVFQIRPRTSIDDTSKIEQ